MAVSRTAFVTGGTGFLGSHLVDLLLEEGYAEVRCLVRSRKKWLDGTDIVSIPGTLEDREALERGCSGVDVVYHLAAVTRAQEWETYRKVNIDGTRRLLDVISGLERKPRRTLAASSLAVIGTGTDGLAHESTPAEPVSGYGRSKIEMERVVGTYQADVPTTIIRPSVVYGPRDRDLLTFFRTVNYGLCPIVGDPERPEISLVHARDLVRGMIQAAHAPVAEGETYFISSERPYSWAEIKAAACEALDRRALTIPVPRKAVAWFGTAAEQAGRLAGFYPPFNREKARELLHACKMCSVEKARRDFDYRQHDSLADGFSETAAWYRREDWL